MSAHQSANFLVRNAALALAGGGNAVGGIFGFYPHAAWSAAELVDSTAQEILALSAALEADVVPQWSQISYSAAHGVGAFAATSRIRNPLLPVGDSPISVNADATTNRDASLVLAPANPSFLYGDASYVECYLHLPGVSRVTPRVSRLLLGVASEVARLASASDAPLLFMQTPASAPRRTRHNRSVNEVVDATLRFKVRQSQNAGIRFAAAIPERSAEARMRFRSALAALATEHHLGFYISDRRHSRRGGDWFEVVIPSPADFRRDDDSDDPIEAYMSTAISIVGPAQVGTSSQLLSYLEWIGVGVRSLTKVVLEDQSVLQLVVDGLEHLASDSPLTVNEWRESNSEARSTPESAPPDLGKVSDFIVYAQPLREPIDTLALNRKAVWASWEIPSSAASTSAVLRALQKAVNSEEQASERNLAVGPETTGIDYLIARRSRSGDLRGRCKMSLPASTVDKLSHRKHNDALTLYCRSIEAAWRATIRSSVGGHDAEVQVAWRELWLGRWWTLHGGVQST